MLKWRVRPQFLKTAHHGATVPGEKAASGAST